MARTSQRPSLTPRAAKLGFLQGLIPWTLLVSIGLCCISLHPEQSQAEAKSQEQESMPQWIQPTSFDYSPEGKQDPFRPFIEPEQEGQERSSQEQQPQRILTPLQRVRPSQLKLVGVLWDPQQPEQALAMVELPNGKGYVLQQGTKVGDQQGRVINISPGQVLIQEQTRNITGQEETQKVVLKLEHSAGDKDE
ncbi:MAG: pilus assembly protein PilP [Desulfohalobiaceae bacterium]